MYTGNNPAALRSREYIVQTFLKLAETTSVSEMSIKQIMDGSGLSRQTFYQIFETKEEILEYCVDRLFGDFMESIENCAVSDLCNTAKVFFAFFDRQKTIHEDDGAKRQKLHFAAKVPRIFARGEIHQFPSGGCSHRAGAGVCHDIRRKRYGRHTRGMAQGRRTRGKRTGSGAFGLPHYKHREEKHDGELNGYEDSRHSKAHLAGLSGEGRLYFFCARLQFSLPILPQCRPCVGIQFGRHGSHGCTGISPKEKEGLGRSVHIGWRADASAGA